MANCKNCLHFEACNKREKEIIDGINRVAEYAEPFANKFEVRCSERKGICKLFKDRSRFTELPFKSRSHYYRILSEIDGYVIAIIFQSINAYHDREEAEQALKEREENETDN